MARDRPQVAEVEDGPEINEEAVSALAGEDDETVGQPVDGRSRQLLIVRRGADADIARGAGEHSPAPPRRVDTRRRRAPGGGIGLDHRQGVRLAAVPSRAVTGGGRVGDGSRVVEERRRIRDRRGELELVRDGGDPGPGVVDVDLVQHIVTDRRCCADDGLGAELEEVRPAVGILQWDVVGQDRDRIGCVRADERVQVRAVSGRVFGNCGCFLVGRHDQFTSW